VIGEHRERAGPAIVQRPQRPHDPRTLRELQQTLRSARLDAQRAGRRARGFLVGRDGTAVG
jgi:hypothetical protein